MPLHQKLTIASASNFHRFGEIYTSGFTQARPLFYEIGFYLSQFL
jgi:hypothetical protein